MKPKVLIFSIAYKPHWGGAELAVKEITDRISEFEFEMVTKKFNKKDLPKEQIGNIIVHRINSSKLLFPFKACFTAQRLHKKNNYDIIWSIMANRAGFAALFFKITHPKIKFLLTLQEGDPFEYPQKRAGIIWLFVGRMFKWIFRKADYIQTISNYLADWAKQMKARCPVEVVPNGVDINGFKIQDLRFKKEKNDETVLITTSRLVKKNGLEDLIKATKILIDEGYKIKTLILGSGPLEKDLRFKIQDLRLENKIQLLGHVEQEKIPEYLKSADIFVRPSLSEGLGTSFLEAMAAGLPIIGTPVGGIPDFLTDPRSDLENSKRSDLKPTGLFCEPKNPKSVAEKIKLLIKDEDLKNRLVNNSKNLIIEKYNWDNIAQKMKKIIHAIIFSFNR